MIFSLACAAADEPILALTDLYQTKGIPPNRESIVIMFVLGSVQAFDRQSVRHTGWQLRFSCLIDPDELFS